MKLSFKALGQPTDISNHIWNDWKWQLRHTKKLSSPFPHKSKDSFTAEVCPYYLRLIDKEPVLRPIVQPSEKENSPAVQEMKDPLGEKQHSPQSRLIHRYPDRILFLVTDQCAVYCRYCTRKRFTGKKQALIPKTDWEKGLDYIQKNIGIREVILSGGDPLSLSDSLLDKMLESLRSIEHIEIIRIASRMPVVCPMRLTDSLIQTLKKYQPVFLMTHFNHPLELTEEAQKALTRVADSGILMFNQTVLLNQINNHPSIIQALMRRLLYLRVKPYYMFQCDPSEGTDHFRTSLPNSQWIQRELWGCLSGLALPNLSVDIPGGGGKVGIVPDFIVKKEDKQWLFKGWDGFESAYINPLQKDSADIFKSQSKSLDKYKKEWEVLKKQTYGKTNLSDESL